MNKKPIIAFLYDFDKTLCTTDMQDYTFIPSLGYTPGEFWSIANSFGFENRMDGLLAYMYTMIEECRKKGIRLDRDYLVSCGHAIELFPGVQDWFSRINAFGETLGVEIEHYVLSSGLREIIEGSGVSHEFKEIYACEFFYNEEGLASWPKLDVNFTNKTQFVYRINKGILDVAKDKELNASMPDDSKRIPFTNMIYIGDGLSDVPCMKMMRAYGGQAVAVYQDSNRAGVEDLLAKGRVDFIFPADYRDGTLFDETMKNIVRKIAIADALAEDVDYSDVDMVILPGGIPGTPNLAENKTVTDTCVSFARAGKKVAAICAAPSVLAQYGLLAGRRATCYPGFEDRCTGAQMVDADVVTDGQITTGRALGAAIPFALELVRLLTDEQTAARTAEEIVYRV